MSWSLSIGRIAGTEIRVHLTLALFLVWIGLASYQAGGREAAVTAVVFISLLFLCVLLHEMGHALTARSFGIPTPDITLLPIGGVARLQRMPEKPGEEIVVALGGPAVNVVIASFLYFWTQLPPDFANAGLLFDNTESMAARLMSANIMIVLFNMIPAFPMDGGRVLRALLATTLPYGRATRVAAFVGQAFAFFFGFLGLFGNPMLLFVALFVYIAASQEATLASLKDLSASLSVTDAMITLVATLPPDATIGQAAEALLRTSQHEFPIVDAAGGVQGILTRDDMISALQKRGPETPVLEAMRTKVPTVHFDASFDEAYQLMESCNCPALPVVDSMGRMVGMITPENVGELIMIRSASPARVGPSWRRVTA
jgi:Zn-dependent protease/CBS domain-containing protein